MKGCGRLDPFSVIAYHLSLFFSRFSRQLVQMDENIGKRGVHWVKYRHELLCHPGARMRRYTRPATRLTAPYRLSHPCRGVSYTPTAEYFCKTLLVCWSVKLVFISACTLTHSAEGIHGFTAIHSRSQWKLGPILSIISMFLVMNANSAARQHFFIFFFMALLSPFILRANGHKNYTSEQMYLIMFAITIWLVRTSI